MTKVSDAHGVAVAKGDNFRRAQFELVPSDDSGPSLFSVDEDRPSKTVRLGRGDKLCLRYVELKGPSKRETEALLNLVDDRLDEFARLEAEEDKSELSDEERGIREDETEILKGLQARMQQVLFPEPQRAGEKR